MAIFLGIIGSAIGAMMVIRTDWMVRGFGKVPWAEEKIGPGGTWFFYKVIGIIIIFFSFLAITGLLGGFTQFVLGPLIRRSAF